MTLFAKYAKIIEKDNLWGNIEMGLHDGHRGRMYEKVRKGGLAEHEWLEVLLFNALPRKNTNELAHRLIARFGSIPKILVASMDELQDVEGVGVNVAAYLKTLGHVFENYKETFELKYVEKYDTKEFLRYVKKKYEELPFEVVDVYLLDAVGKILKSKRFSIESVCAVKMVPEELSSFLLGSDSSGVVMVHNHPLGNCEPSQEDERMTRNCQMLCSMQNKLFCDHIIYSPKGIYSYYLGGKMQEITKNYSIDKLLEKRDER